MNVAIPTSRWARALLLLLCAHLVWGIARIPGKVYAKRIRDIDRYHAVGPIRYHLDNEHRQGAEAVRYLVENTRDDAVVLWRGEWRGSFEFVAPLIAPRLLVDDSAVPEGATECFGRPLARGLLPDGRSGVWVLVGRGNALELGIR